MTLPQPIPANATFEHRARATVDRSRHRGTGLARDADAGSFSEIFLFSAVATVLIVRGYLALTGYPQVGGGELHIAHLLWGGLLMLVALLLLLTCLGRAPKGTAAWLGGIGFGLFIDEVGKFVTEDNDYFFRPAVAIMYVVFVALFLATRAFLQRRELSPTEHLRNALTALDLLAAGALDERSRSRALDHLRASGEDDPVARVARDLLLAATPVATEDGRFAQARRRVRRAVRALAGWRWFGPVVMAIFVVQAAAYVAQAVWFVVEDRGDLAADLDGLSFVETGSMLSATLAGALVVAGAALLPRSRPAAFRAFDRSLLVSIFLTQFFAFAQHQFAALTGLAVSLCLLAGVRVVTADQGNEDRVRSA